MKNYKQKTIFSLITKLLIIICVIWGLILCFSAKGGFMSGTSLLLYFTTQSNIWIAVVALFLGIVQIINYRKSVFVLGHKLYLIQEIFTVAITLTGIIYCFVLLPTTLITKDGPNPFTLPQMLLHVAVPVLAVVDFLCFTGKVKFKKSECLFSIILPLYYLIFSFIGYISNWDFGGGENYPYFFMNYASPAGFFGFSNTVPYFMGSFYWFIFIFLLVCGMSLLYITIINKKEKNQK